MGMWVLVVLLLAGWFTPQWYSISNRILILRLACFCLLRTTPSHTHSHPNVHQLFPADVVQRAREYHALIGPSGTGAYSHSQGILGFRQHVAEFIQRRDSGYPAGNIFLTNGASSGIGMVLQGLLANNNDAVMIPIPQYPIYSGTYKSVYVLTFPAPCSELVEGRTKQSLLRDLSISVLLSPTCVLTLSSSYSCTPSSHCQIRRPPDRVRTRRVLELGRIT